MDQERIANKERAVGTPRRMPRQAVWLVVAGALAGCAHAHGQAHYRCVEESSDVVCIGEHEGYDVSLQCIELSMTHEWIVVVRGRGRRWFDDAAPGSPGREEALARFRAQVVEPALAGLRSVHGVGSGLGCSEGCPNVWMRDGSDASKVIRLLGRLLVSLDLREEIRVAPRAAMEPDITVMRPRSHEETTARGR